MQKQSGPQLPAFVSGVSYANQILWQAGKQGQDISAFLAILGDDKNNPLKIAHDNINKSAPKLDYYSLRDNAKSGFGVDTPLGAYLDNLKITHHHPEIAAKLTGLLGMARSERLYGDSHKDLAHRLNSIIHKPEYADKAKQLLAPYYSFMKDLTPDEIIFIALNKKHEKVADFFKDISGDAKLSPGRWLETAQHFHPDMLTTENVCQRLLELARDKQWQGVLALVKEWPATANGQAPFWHELWQVAIEQKNVEEAGQIFEAIREVAERQKDISADSLHNYLEIHGNPIQAAEGQAFTHVTKSYKEMLLQEDLAKKINKPTHAAVLQHLAPKPPQLGFATCVFLADKLPELKAAMQDHMNGSPLTDILAPLRPSGVRLGLTLPQNAR